MPDEPHRAGRIVIVDPRRTVTVNACEVEAGKDNVLHLALNSGTDLALFNALSHLHCRQGLGRQGVDRALRRSAFDPARRRANKMSASRTARRRITGLTPEEIVKAAEWIAQPKDGGKRRRTMIAYEKGLIWGNDNYRTNGALVNIALATGNIGRLGGGCVRMGGHQEGYVRPSDAGIVGRPPLYRPAADLRPRRRASRLGLRSLQDHAQRRSSSSASTRSAPTW